MFVLASILGECTIRCPNLFSSWFPVSWWCPGGVPVVWRWCSVSRWCNGPVSVVSRWCPNGVPVVFRVSVVSRCRIAGPVVSRSCAGGGPVVSRSCPVVSQWCCIVSRCPGGWCPSRVPVVSQWRLVVFQWNPVMSRWLVSLCCLGGVAVLLSGVLVVSRASWVLVVFHPVVSRSCPVFHAVATTISENLRLWGGWCSAV